MLCSVRYKSRYLSMAKCRRQMCAHVRLTWAWFWNDSYVPVSCLVTVCSSNFQHAAIKQKSFQLDVVLCGSCSCQVSPLYIRLDNQFSVINQYICIILYDANCQNYIIELNLCRSYLYLYACLCIHIQS